jgi:TetR/AcrR family transcriptional regulator, acrAB operon repressor
MAVKPQVTQKRRGAGRPRSGETAGRGAREAILDAATRVFAERGYRGATVDAILAEAGLSKGAFYWHFASKEEVMRAVLAERVERPVKELIELIRSAGPDENVSAVATRRFAEFLEGGRDAILLEHEYESLAARDPRLRRRYARQRKALRLALADALAARAQQLGAPPLDTPAEEIATAFLALIRGLARERLLDPSGVPGHILGNVTGLIYIGLLARAQGGEWQASAVLDSDD